MAACTSGAPSTTQYIEYSGETMGTYFRVYYADDAFVSNAAIDSILTVVNQGVNYYQEDSEISRFNQWPADAEFHIVDDAFRQNVVQSIDMYAKTQGHFNAQVGPLVYYWGFGHDRKKPEQVSASTVDSLRRLCSPDMLEMVYASDQLSAIIKRDAACRYDLNAIAKGYGVDEIAAYLDQLDIKHYLVDIGGEVRLRGNNPRGSRWRLLINTPVAGAGLSDSYGILEASDVGIATSGNYRNQYHLGDSLIVHTINPLTGYPEINQILSATVMAPDCQTADAIATACMSAGVEQAMKWVADLQEVELFLIYTEDGISMTDTMSSGMSPYIVRQQ